MPRLDTASMIAARGNIITRPAEPCRDGGSAVAAFAPCKDNVPCRAGTGPTEARGAGNSHQTTSMRIMASQAMDAALPRRSLEASTEPSELAPRDGSARHGVEPGGQDHGGRENRAISVGFAIRAKPKVRLRYQTGVRRTASDPWLSPGLPGVDAPAPEALPPRPGLQRPAPEALPPTPGLQRPACNARPPTSGLQGLQRFANLQKCRL